MLLLLTFSLTVGKTDAFSDMYSLVMVLGSLTVTVTGSGSLPLCLTGNNNGDEMRVQLSAPSP